MSARVLHPFGPRVSFRILLLWRDPTARLTDAAAWVKRPNFTGITCRNFVVGRFVKPAGVAQPEETR